MSTILPSFQSEGPVGQIALRLSGLREQIKKILLSQNRPEGDVMIVASSRALMADPVSYAAQAGIQHFCEEFLPEGIAKRPVVDHKVPGLTWHFTGSLLGKKLAMAVEFFDWIHSIDKITQVSALKSAIDGKNRQISVLVEVNPVGQEKRLGVDPKDLPELLAALTQLPRIQLQGLSFKSEQFLSKDTALKGFDLMREIHENCLKKGYLPKTARHCAMGSSRDYEAAVKSGSTMLRLGEALFGESAYHMMGGNTLEAFDL